MGKKRTCLLAHTLTTTSRQHCRTALASNRMEFSQIRKRKREKTLAPVETWLLSHVVPPSLPPHSTSHCNVREIGKRKCLNIHTIKWTRHDAPQTIRTPCGVTQSQFLQCAISDSILGHISSTQTRTPRTPPPEWASIFHYIYICAIGDTHVA